LYSYGIVTVTLLEFVCFITCFVKLLFCCAASESCLSVAWFCCVNGWSV